MKYKIKISNINNDECNIYDEDGNFIYQIEKYKEYPNFPKQVKVGDIIEWYTDKMHKVIKIIYNSKIIFIK